MSTPSPSALQEELTATQRVLRRERHARKEAERLLEDKSRALYESNQVLKEANETLEQRVLERTKHLQELTEKLEQSKVEAEHANQSKSDFLAMMSHEMRTPLNSIIGLASLLAESPDSLSPSEDYPARIEANARVLTSWIDDLLDFAKLEAGLLSVERQPCNLSQFLHHLKQTIADIPGRDDVDIHFDVAANCPSHIQADDKRLHQIILNFLSNAIKYRRGGHVALKLYIKDAHLFFEVKDDGLGIPKEQQSQIFTQFMRVEAQSHQHTKGTGLGLYICKVLAERMGGYVDFSSLSGVGSTFWLAIPADIERTDVETEMTRNEQLHSTGKHALIVEDEEDNRLIFKHLLKRAGFTFDVTHNGRAGLEQWRRHKYDLIVTDIAMPEMDGLSMLRQGRADESAAALPHVPAIISSAHALTHVKDEVLQMPHSQFIGKPVDKHYFQVCCHLMTSQRLNVAFVDDNDDNHFLFGAFLKRFPNTHVNFYIDGHVALADFEKMPADIVFLDLNMPGIDGVSMARILTQQYPMMQLVACTGDVGEQTRQACDDAGMHTFLPKPLHRSSFDEAIFNLLELRQERLSAAAPAPHASEQHISDIANATEISTVLPDDFDIDPDIADLVPAYIAKRMRQIEELHSLFQQSNWATLQRIGHDLKGSGGAYGFEAISMLGANIENAAREQDIDSLRHSIEQYASTIQAINKWLHTHNMTASI